MSSITIQVPDFLRRQIERLTAQDGLTMDQFFTTAVSEKISLMEAVDYISQRAAKADDQAFLEAMSRIPATPVSEPWDQR